MNNIFFQKLGRNLKEVGLRWIPNPN